MKIEEKLFLDRYVVDEDNPHLKIRDQELCQKCEKKQCLYACPAGVYTWDGKQITVAYADCLECGTCRVICREKNNIDWKYPRGGYGVSYKFG